MNNTMKRLLSLLLALSLCFALALQTSAAADETVVTETPVEETEVPVILTQEDVKAAWTILLETMAPEQAAAYQTPPANVRQDILEAVVGAIETCTLCVNTENEVLPKLETLKQSVNASTALTEEQKQDILQKLAEPLQQTIPAASEQTVEQLSEPAQTWETFDPVLCFMEDIQKLPAFSLTYTPNTEGMDAYLAQLTVLDLLMDRIEDLLEGVALLPQIDQQLAALGEAQESDGELAQNYASDLKALKRERAAINDLLDDYTELEEAEERELYSSILALDAELKAFPSKILTGSLAYSDALRTELTEVKAEMEIIAAGLIFGQVGLGVGALAILLVIVVAIFSIGRARGEKVDLSGMASTEDLNTVNQQNVLLMNQIKIMEERMDHLTRQHEALKERVEQEGVVVPDPIPEPAPETESSLVPAPDLISEPVPETEPEPTPIPVEDLVSLGSDRQVCNLRMQYNPISPATSFMTMDNSGSLVLFTDNTVEPTADEMDMSNEISGWINNGLYYLFDLEVDGRLLDPQRDKLPEGYFYIRKILRRATVKMGGNNSYLVQNKGLIRLR